MLAGFLLLVFFIGGITVFNKNAAKFSTRRKYYDEFDDGQPALKTKNLNRHNR